MATFPEVKIFCDTNMVKESITRSSSVEKTRKNNSLKRRINTPMRPQGTNEQHQDRK
jgi:precorrin isomerase